MIDEKELGWLIRDNSNVIRGPFKYGEVLQLIKKGQLKGKTEVSRANSYWFAMEEKAELGRFFPELGIKAPEQTQMTATLTQVSEPADQGVEITQFTQAPTRKELSENKPATASSGEKIEWLNDEFAEEFGGEESLAMQNTSTDINNQPKAVTPDHREMKPEKREPTTDELARQEMLKRASVKADTLPSEHKSFTGERPKPINTMMKGPDKGQSMIQPAASNMVTVPVDVPDSQARILTSEDEAAAVESGKKRKIFVLIGATSLGLVLATAGIVFWNSQKQSSVVEKKVPISGSSEGLVRKSLLLFQLEGAKEALSEFELEPGARGKVTLPIAQALMKKEFLYDADGAFMSLQTARSLATDKRAEAEVDNLMAIYRFERDREGSIEGFRRVVSGFSSEPVFRYNLALALLRSGKQQESIQAGSGLMGMLKRENPLAEDVAVLTGWAKDIASKGNDPSIETAYLNALDSNPNSAKARLGLAIYRLRRGGLKDSESDFRAFLESLPELDPPTRALNFRKMNDFDFYNYARSQLRDLNIPLGAVGRKPSPLVMAVDAIISCLQSRTGEAGKILEGALSADPGDFHLMKAVGFHRWKEGRFPEIVDLLKDLPKERNSFSINLLLGKAYLKTGRRDLAEAHFENLTTASPMRSEGWSLLGDIQLQQGRLDVAKKNLENALQRDSLDLLALRGLDRLGQANVITPELAANLPF